MAFTNQLKKFLTKTWKTWEELRNELRRILVLATTADVDEILLLEKLQDKLRKA